jgi:hypothetical protein
MQSRHAEVFNEEIRMARTRGMSPEGDRLLLGEIVASITLKEWPGIPEWPGRYWLPESSPLQAGGKDRLIGDDGGARLLFARAHARPDLGTAVVATADDTRFE